MTAASSDCELVSAYVAQGSEPAFRALVQRHVDLVYATALRQLGDPGLAEEVAQNVFVALARKAPRLGGIETLAGWLHRTAILEAKARIRSELRRRRREEAAAELVSLQREGASPFAAMVPLVDEALLSLRDGDRLALMLRFWEERSLREVGVSLGVDEDAARKRVSRALDRLTDFFRKKGLPITAGGGSAALMANAAQGAPPMLALSASNAALATGGAATGLNLLLFQIMALTKTQTAVICALVAVTPLAWQWHSQARIAREQAALDSQLAADSRQAAELESNTRSTRQSVLLARDLNATNDLRLASLKSQLAPARSTVYHWDDNSPVARVPKQLLASLGISGVANPRGQLSEQIKEVLQMTDTEAQNSQAAIDRFLAAYHAAEAAGMRRVDPTNIDYYNGHKPGDTRVWEVPAIGDKLGELRQTLSADLQAAVGPERGEYLRDSLGGWMPLNDEYTGMSSAMAVFNFDHRVRFFEPKPGAGRLNYSIGNSKGEGVWMSIEVDDIPSIYRSDLQDWIDIAQSQPAEK